MKLRCPNCEALIPKKNINVEKTVALCAECGDVFNFGEMIPGRKRKRQAQPGGVRVVEKADGVMVKAPILPTPPLMRTLAVAGYLLIALTAVLFSITLIARARFNPVAVIVTLTVALPLVYYALAGLFNRLQITLDHAALQVQQRPLPVLTGKRFRRDEVVRFVAVATAGGQTTYDVEARLSNGSRTILLDNLSEDDALYVADTLNDTLDESDDLYESLLHLSDDEFPRRRRSQ